MVERLKKRADFVKCAKARDAAKAPRPTLVLQGRKRAADDVGPANARIGFTVTRKVGNAVVRNRVRRRLREAVRLAERTATLDAAASPYRPDTDYVLIGRLATLNAPFDTIKADLAGALRTLHKRLDDEKPTQTRLSHKKDKKPRSDPSQ